ncbi:MAG: hypothetical protein A2744_02110 [Candidatus Buchananbacteria bacterium RIFCSPHIGHO2_01_FULL_44_11]|uniref:Peptidase C39-like domain-containing protein n=1 Tax=Candidatus Buchananbacteria bacterium RIFCSPHIGHO2_01_FULL_44_11 TaxID=1797535 RepID=A0A1G1XZF0_9BACT|nr:MAG: hypothetical protein A2744_02110 [Candidatus Buchananbacteria bacterium RIFCSPHIGHO2_01_FULL_44_11]
MLAKILLIIAGLILLAGCRQNLALNQPELVNNSAVPSNQAEPTKSDQPAIVAEPKPKSPELPDEEAKEVLAPPDLTVSETFNQPVSFTSQAPYGVWDELHGEACEEASMIMVAKYFKQQLLDSHIAEQAILDLVEWENDNDYEVDLTAAETSEILSQYFGLKSELIYDVTAERIKKELAQGKLIIVPAAGRQLGNPYFQTPGPIYHMLVITGYDQDEFITNDPGTKRGEGFKYKFQTLLGAVADWDHTLDSDGMTDQEIDSTQSVIIAVWL